MLPSSTPQEHPKIRFRHSVIWLAGILTLIVAIYLLLSLERARINRKFLETTRFTDAIVSLEKVDNLLVLNSVSASDLPEIQWTAYRAGLFVQGRTVLSVMKINDSFLTEKERILLQETGSLFDRLQRGLVAGSPLPNIVETDRHLMFLAAELSGWSARNRMILLHRIRALDFGRAFIILSVLGGGGLFLLRKTRLFRKTSRQNRFYQALLRIDRLILTLPEIEELLSETCRIVVEEGDVRMARFYRHDSESKKGHLTACFGIEIEELNRFEVSSEPSLPGGRGLYGETVRSKIPVVWNNLQDRLTEGPLRDLFRGYGIFSGAGVPVFRKEALYGAFFFHSDKEDFFDPGFVKLIEILVENISFAIENRDREDERKSREEDVTRLSLFDPLTHLPNRRLFQDRLHQAMERHLRTNERFGVGILDLDGFKLVNDRLGHPAGDSLLVQVAERLKGVLRGTDTLARLGGDEFGIIFAALEGESGSAIFQRVIGSLSLPFELGQESATVGGSLGITIMPPDEGNGENLLKHADIALYQVKEHGKNGWELFRPAMMEALENCHRIKEELARSLQENRFVIHYQPQVEMASGKLLGAEALLRWDHPERGLLDSKHFIKVLEGSELIIDVEKWVLEQILSQISDWTERKTCPKVRMNIGVRHLLSSTFMDNIRKAFSRHPEVRPQSLELDITETKSFRDIRKVKAVFDECRRIGISISIGNIGTEHGSLAYIQTLGVDRVTIDQSFVRNLPKSPQDMAIVASLVTSAQLLLINVIGEGIETEEEGNLLLKWGCRIGQGFAIAPPMPPEKIPEWHKQYRPFESWSHWHHVPWEPKDYPLLMAKEAARVFYENFLAGIDKPGETRVEWIDSHRCMQGRWIDGNGRLRFGDMQEFKEYREAHDHLHSLIREAMVARDTGDLPSLDFHGAEST